LTPTESWWTPSLAEKLSQGDIVADQASVMSAVPPTFLKARSFKGGEPGWGVSPNPTEFEGRVHMLATGSVRAALVISHGCELDKMEGNPRRHRVLLAPVFPIDSVENEHRQQILSQSNRALLPLPQVPTLGTCYADLRSIFASARASVDAAVRLASMTTRSELRLHAQLVAFLLRKEAP
jgi:hypothetical protein